jgi:hypothetical protein
MADLPGLDVAVVGAGFGGLGNRWVEALSRRMVWETGCRSWYTTAGRNTNNWPTNPYRYHRQLRRFDLRDYRVRRRPPPGS